MPIRFIEHKNNVTNDEVLSNASAVFNRVKRFVKFVLT